MITATVEASIPISLFLGFFCSFNRIIGCFGTHLQTAQLQRPHSSHRTRQRMIYLRQPISCRIDLGLQRFQLLLRHLRTPLAHAQDRKMGSHRFDLRIQQFKYEGSASAKHSNIYVFTTSRYKLVVICLEASSQMTQI